MPENILLDDDDDVLQERHVSGEELEQPRYDPSAEPSCHGEKKARLNFNLQYMNLCYATIQKDMVEFKIVGMAILPWESRSSWNILPGHTCGAVRPERWIILSKSRTGAKLDALPTERPFQSG